MMPKLYASILQDIKAAAECLPKAKRAAYIQRAIVQAKQNPNNLIPGS